MCGRRATTASAATGRTRTTISTSISTTVAFHGPGSPWCSREPVYATAPGLILATKTGHFQLAPDSPGVAAGQAIPNFSVGFTGGARHRSAPAWLSFHPIWCARRPAYPLTHWSPSLERPPGAWQPRDHCPTDNTACTRKQARPATARSPSWDDRPGTWRRCEPGQPSQTGPGRSVLCSLGMGPKRPHALRDQVGRVKPALEVRCERDAAWR